MDSPVPGAKEKIVEMLKRHGEVTEDVERLEKLVEEQRKELEQQNSSRLGGMYDDDEGVAVTSAMVDAEEDQVHEIEEKIKAMQEQVFKVERC
jgi:predicted ATP-grasp superfamily ATP-dependent carboligase